MGPRDRKAGRDKKLTNGERFERITEAAEADAVDFMLDMADGIMRMMDKYN